ncbi:MAG: trypsin-like serine protease [Planctomycetes bacterium]|nr:trypsin-like serine protease [Planctomycetota bacterium]
MKRHTFLSSLLLASGALALGSVQAPAQAGAAGSAPAADAAKGHGVTYHVATREVRTRMAPRAAKVAAAPAVRARPGFLPPALRDLNEETFRPRKVFGTDDRYPVSDPTAYPWSTVCKVFARFPDGTHVEGSAVLIGDGFALTAGHVVHDADYGGFAETVEIVPAYDFGDEPFGTLTATDVTSFNGWTSDQDYDYDLALLTLDAKSGDQTGWLGLGAYADTYLAGLTVNTGGYPSDLDSGDAMYGATGTVERVLPGQLQMRGSMDAAQGQSGSGVWVRRDDGRYVVGVVSTETSTYNQAARITGTVYDALASWMDAAVGADFTVTALAAPIPAEFQAPYTGSASVTVANDGADGDTVEVSLVARDLLGARTLVSRRDVYVAGGDELSVSLPIVIGAGFRAGSFVLEAEVNGDRAIAETDYDNDVRVGPSFVVLPAFDDRAFGRTAYDTLGPGGVARHRIVVPSGFRNLKMLLSAPAGGYAVVTRPDGVRSTVSAGRTVRVASQAGTWLVDIRAPSNLRRERSFQFRMSDR